MLGTPRVTITALAERMTDAALDPHRLMHEHDALLALMLDVDRVVGESTPAPAAALRAVTALRVALDAHLAQEDAHLYPRLMGSASLAEQAAGLQLISEFRHLTGDWGLYLLRWKPAAIARDWASFAAETRAMLARLRARVARENGLLRPFATQAA